MEKLPNTEEVPSRSNGNGPNPQVCCNRRLSQGCTHLMYACQQGLSDEILLELRCKVKTHLWDDNCLCKCLSYYNRLNNPKAQNVPKKRTAMLHIFMSLSYCVWPHHHHKQVELDTWHWLLHAERVSLEAPKSFLNPNTSCELCATATSGRGDRDHNKYGKWGQLGWTKA